MSLTRLHVRDVRNIVDQKIEFHGKLNLVYGKNGSGKTSLLEAIYFLGTGRSYRNHRILPLITQNKDECMVTGELSETGVLTQLGVQRAVKGKRLFKVNGQTIKRSSSLAIELPILQLGPETIELLTGAPQFRRRFMNWGVFHVEPMFNDLWGDANRCLKQRNEVLRKASLIRVDLEIWTRELVSLAEKIDEYRRDYFSEFVSVFIRICHSLSAPEDVKCEYHRGWDISKDLGSVFSEQQAMDVKRGYTQSGFQRANIRLTIRGQDVVSICSRGELKILTWAMVLAQGEIHQSKSIRNLLYLVDDASSELDNMHRIKVCKLLLESEGQVVATGIDATTLGIAWGDVPSKLFHVEQGSFSHVELIQGTESE